MAGAGGRRTLLVHCHGPLCGLLRNSVLVDLRLDVCDSQHAQLFPQNQRLNYYSTETGVVA